MNRAIICIAIYVSIVLCKTKLSTKADGWQMKLPPKYNEG